MEPLILQTASEDAGKRLDAWLAEQTELTRSAVQKLMGEGRVTVEGKPLAKNTRLTGGETVLDLYSPGLLVIASDAVRPDVIPQRLCRLVRLGLLDQAPLHRHHLMAPRAGDGIQDAVGRGCADGYPVRPDIHTQLIRLSGDFPHHFIGILVVIIIVSRQL
mgnify:CR=1 FL=1